MAGIYVHIPFCKKACHYCNFHFSTTQHQLPAMVEAIGKEAALNSNYLKEPVSTIYLGGGTPSLLDDAQVRFLLGQMQQLFTVQPDTEITLEANPDDIDAAKLAGWKKAGINRLSIGIQSFYEEDLRWMNRAHNAEQATNAVRLAQQQGFSNITIDLIYGAPHLTDEKWLHNIEKALALDVPHLSCYALTVEPKTALAKMIEKHASEEVDPEKQARHFSILTQRLAQAGFEHYEISNFAKPGFRSRHNSSYWQGKPYIGLGPSAHSFNGESRQWNMANNSLYLASLQKDILPFEIELLTPVQQLNEYIMISLRTMEGISIAEVLKRFGAEKIPALMRSAEQHLQHGYLVITNDHLLLTPEGKFLADGIAADLFFDEEN